MKKEGNINFYNVFIEFYKFSVTVEKMIATKQCLKCPWKTDVGNKLVCMFKWCVYSNFKKKTK